MTIDVVQLWNQVQTTAKTSTSGYQSANDFNADLATVQYRIANILCDNYDVNQKIEDALIGLIQFQTNIASSSGIVSLPTSYFRLLTHWVNVGGVPQPAGKIAINQVSTYTTAYVRKPNAITNDYYYYYIAGAIQMLPQVQVSTTLVYCIVPPVATIILTPTAGAGADYVTPTAGTNLIWSPVVYNLFVYFMLEMLGLEMRDNILYEFSQLGIPKEAYIGMTEKGEQ